MSRVRCAGCREYVDKDHAVKMGLGYVCDDSCFHLYRSRAIDKHRRRAHHRALHRQFGNGGLKRRVRGRDGNSCRSCGGGYFLQVHHINYRSQGGPDEEWNLITLCNSCHMLVHSDKRRYQPLLRGVIWMHYVESMFLSLPEFEDRFSTSPERQVHAETNGIR